MTALRTARHLLAAGAAVVALAGGAITAAAAEPTKVSFITSWKAQAEHGGYYQALAKGYFAKHGVDVTIRMGGPGVNNAQLVAAGAVDFAMGSNNDYAHNLQKEGADIVAVMAGFQKIPQILMSHKGVYASLESMKGKPIMIAAGSIGTFWPFLRAKYGYDDAQIRKYTFNLAPFLTDKTAIQQGYLSSETFMARKEGVEPDVWLLADAGYGTYASLTLVPRKWIAENPAAVKGFVEASIEGWYDYLYGDPTPGNVLIRKDNPDMGDDVIAFAIAQMKAHGIVDGGDAAKLGIGAMSDARWKEHFDALVSYGLLPKDADYKKAFSLDFVNKGYGMEMKPRS